ncbi:MAG: 23S rRNA (pseudouridine(1915)-N(3))-methyltransferase RlmH [Pseudomonadota bacterium]
MELLIAAVGRLKGGPEAEMVAEYAARATAAGRPLGLGPLTVAEIDDRRARRSGEQADRLLEAAGDSVIVVLDERGRQLASPAFAERIATWRDDGRRRASFLIGGADGHDPGLRGRADLLLGFGPMVWPHALARVMLAEQLYRAVSILAGSPYHRA